MSQKSGFRIVALLLLISHIRGNLVADPASKPHDFAAGDPISAAQMNANFDTLYNLISGNLDSVNLKNDSMSLAKVSGGLIGVSGSNVGIGANLPHTRFQIQSIAETGTGTIYTTGTAVLGSGTAFDSELRIGDEIIVGEETRTIVSIEGEANLTIDSTFTSELNNQIFVFSRPILVVDDSGKVGIGVFNPAEKFTVNGEIMALAGGSIRFADANSSHYVGFQAPATVTSNTIWTLPSADGFDSQVLTTDGVGALSWSSVTGDDLGNHSATQNVLLSGHWLSSDGDSEGISVDVNGNVTVSGTVAGRDLDMDGTKLDGITAGAADTTDDPWTGNGDVYTTLGNVGIGTANPLMKVDVVGNIGVTGTVDSRDVSVDGAKLDSIATGAADTTEDSWTGSGDVYMTSGNIGIGTQAPSAILHIEDNDPIDAVSALVRNTGSAVLKLVTTTTTIGAGAVDASVYFARTADPLSVNTAFKGNEWDLVASAYPQRYFGVRRWDGNTSILSNPILINFSDGYVKIGTNNSPALGRLHVEGTGDVLFEMDGNVGIGTTTPSQKLEVTGTTKTVGFQLGTSATSGHVLTADSSGVGTWLPVPTGNTLWTENGGNVYRSTGNIGIGTSIPSATLEIKSNLISLLKLYKPSNQDRVGIDFAMNNDSSNEFIAAQIFADIQGDGTGDEHADLFFNTMGFGSLSTKMAINSVGNVGIGEVNTDARLEIIKPSSGPIVYISSSPEADGDIFSVIESGNVGIGTDSPFAKLHISDGSFLLNNPANPVIVGSVSTGNAYNVYVSGGYAYVGDHFSGLRIIDVSDPTDPVIKGTYSTSAEAFDVYISGKYAYLANNSGGLKIIDVSNPASPTLISTFVTPSYARRLHVSGRYVFIACATSGLQIIDVSDPDNPTLAGSYETPTYLEDVFVYGRYAYLAVGGTGLQIVDVSNPGSPSLVGTHNTAGSAVEVRVSGRYAYIADTNYMQIVDVSNPAAPVGKGSVSVANATYSVWISGDYAYITDTNSGLIVIDIQDRTNPTVVGSCNTPTYATDIVVSGKYAYIADGSGGLQIIDLLGADVHVAKIGNLWADSMTLVENGDIGNSMYIRNSLNVGSGGVLTDGNLGVAGSSTFIGNVGIGTTAPAQRLDVAGTIKSTGFQLGTSTTSGYVLTADVSGVGTWQAASGSSFWAESDGNVYRSSGNVGIGIATPSYTLDVSGSVNATTYYGDGSNLTGISGTGQWTDQGAYISADNASNVIVTDSGWLGIGTVNPDGQIHIRGDHNLVQERDTNTQVAASVYQTGGTYEWLLGLRSQGNSDFRLYSWGTSSDVILAEHSTGNVGIGTSSPTSRLDVSGGNISLNGGWLSGDGGNEGVFVKNGGYVGIGTANPSAELHVAGTGAIVNPAGTTAQRPVSPVEGMIRYNTTVAQFEGYDGSEWITINMQSSDGPKIGQWNTTTTTSFDGDANGSSTAFHNGFLYSMGGEGSSSMVNTVQYAAINADGTVGSWTNTSSLLTARKGQDSTASRRGYLYVLGGRNATYFNDVEFTSLNQDGILGAWQTTTSFSIARQAHSAIVYNDYIYVAGGLNSSALAVQDVQYAPLNTDGTIGAWDTTSSLPSGRYHFSLIAHNDFLYAVGGSGDGAAIAADVLYAYINDDGSISSWHSTTPLPSPRVQNVTRVFNDNLFVIGGSDGVLRSDAYRAEINSDGSVGAWVSETSLPIPYIADNAYMHNGRLYFMGVYDGGLNSATYCASIAP